MRILFRLARAAVKRHRRFFARESHPAGGHFGCVFDVVSVVVNSKYILNYYYICSSEWICTCRSCVGLWGIAKARKGVQSVRVIGVTHRKDGHGKLVIKCMAASTARISLGKCVGTLISFICWVVGGGGGVRHGWMEMETNIVKWDGYIMASCRPGISSSKMNYGWNVCIPNFIILDFTKWRLN